MITLPTIPEQTNRTPWIEVRDIDELFFIGAIAPEVYLVIVGLAHALKNPKFQITERIGAEAGLILDRLGQGVD